MPECLIYGCDPIQKWDASYFANVTDFNQAEDLLAFQDLREISARPVEFGRDFDLCEAGVTNRLPDPLCHPEVPFRASSNPATTAGRGGSGSTGSFGSTGSPMQTTIDTPDSAIPKPIRAFISLVDGLADDIDGASSNVELGRIRFRLARLTQNLANGAIASALGKSSGAVSGSDLRQMIGILQTLDNAARTKGAGDPTGIGAQVYRQLTQSARDAADGLIPQVRAIRERQMRQLMGVMAKRQRRGF